MGCTAQALLLFHPMPRVTGNMNSDSDPANRHIIGSRDAALAGHRFPLLRYFMAMSVVATFAVTLFVAILFVKVAEDDFVSRSETKSTKEAAHFAGIFHHSVWAPSALVTPDATIRDIDHADLESFSDQTSFGLNIIRIDFLDPRGAYLDVPDTNTPVTVPRPPVSLSRVIEQGVPYSSFGRGQQVVTIGGDTVNLDLITTFTPLKDVPAETPEEGHVIGIMKVTRDITEEFSQVRSDALRTAIVGSAAAGGVLVGLLFLIVLRADRRLSRQHDQLESVQAQNIQTAKLAAVGELVSGVAHELNNPLSGIWGLARMLKARNLDPSAEEEVSMIYREAERSLGIVQNLLAFARPSSQDPTGISVNEAIEAALELRRHQLELSNIELEVQLQPNLPLVKADDNEIQQVALNLIGNAEQAMVAAHDGGRLLLKTMRNGSMLRFIVSDNGPGIAKQHIDRVFDPFFSTKEFGHGTGLGLSICYSIVLKYGGTIRVESEAPNGATFIIDLPILSDGGARSVD